MTYSDGSTARIAVDDGGADTFWEIRVGGDVTSDEWGEEPGSGQSHTESLKSSGASYEAIYQGNGVMVLNVNGK